MNLISTSADLDGTYKQQTLYCEGYRKESGVSQVDDIKDIREVLGRIPRILFSGNNHKKQFPS